MLGVFSVPPPCMHIYVRSTEQNTAERVWERRERHTLCSQVNTIWLCAAKPRTKSCVYLSVPVLPTTSFDNFAGLVGGFCAVPLALVYPSAFQLKMMGDSMSVFERWWTWLVLVCGCFGAVLCSWQSLATWK